MKKADMRTIPTGNKNLKGVIQLFRPSDSALDLNVHLNLDNSGIQILDVSNLKKGLWVVKVTWENSGSSFYKSKQIEIH